MSRRNPTSFRLSNDALSMLSQLSSARGQSMAAIMERCIREEYARELQSRLKTELIKAKVNHQT